MKLLLASSELHPYSKTGGLADMVGSLGKALAGEGHQVGIVTPWYRGTDRKYSDFRKLDWQLELPLGDTLESGEIWVREPQKNLTVYFVKHPGFYERAGIYNEAGQDYPDNAQRYLFLSKAVVNLARYLPWKPEIVHVHDWQVGLVPLMIKHQAWRDGWQNAPATVLTIHNLAYQGLFHAEAYKFSNLPNYYFHAEGVEQYGNMNSLKSAIEFSDMITTVSPRYAREIMTEEYGCGLDAILRRRQDRLKGILNGVDYDEWSTERNVCLAHSYSADRPDGKARLKAELQLEYGLPARPEVPVFGNITRLVDQKGVDIQLGALEEMLATDLQFVCLGSGAAEFEQAYRDLAARYPDKVGVRTGYDHCLAHRIEAGCDFYLMPSRFEPCGLNQMYSLRYGTVPIVRRTGGLDDSVIDIAEDQERATGIKFTEYSVRALAKAIRKALVLHEHQELYRRYRDNGMRADFSWEKTGDDYLEVYRRAIEYAAFM